MVGRVHTLSDGQRAKICKLYTSGDCDIEMLKIRFGATWQMVTNALKDGGVYDPKQKRGRRYDAKIAAKKSSTVQSDCRA